MFLQGELTRIVGQRLTACRKRQNPENEAAAELLAAAGILKTS
jgi:hypothetical protein